MLERHGTLKKKRLEQLSTENFIPFVLLIGPELKAAKEVCNIIAIPFVIRLFNVKRRT